MATVTPATEESIKLWLKVGNLKKLEQAVLDGYSDQLRGRNSRIPKINKFLKRVPHFQAKIAAIHSTTSTGNLRELENLLDRKGLVLGRDAKGATPLHTAVHFKQAEVVKYILDAFPLAVQARDHQGRTPLHYAALTGDQQIVDLLVEGGADKDAKDTMGNTVKDYAQNPQEFRVSRVESCKWLNKHNSKEITSLLRQPSPISPMTKNEIRSLIQRGDVAKLERLIVQGYGDSVVGETAISARVRDLLESVPEHLNKLRAIDDAIESGSTRTVQNLINRKSLVIARDSQGLTAIHKAAIHGQKDIIKYLLSECPKAVFTKDHDKRTPVHYAAALADDGEIYNVLVEAGGNTSLPDCDGRTPEYYKLNPEMLNLTKVIERKSAGSGKLSHSTSNGGLSKATSKSGKRDPSSGSSESTSIVKQWLRNGDIERLEKAVVDGHGLKLIRETTSDPRGRAFLRTVPVYMTKIGMIHEAVSQGSLRNLKVLLDRKKLAMSRDQLGLGLLHKAVLFGHSDIVQYLLDSYPETLNIKDKVGRTALHYAAVVKDKNSVYPLLLEAGSDVDGLDMKGNSAEHYYANVDDLDVNEIMNRINRQRNRVNNAGNQLHAISKPQESPVFVINGANIRKWIHSEDIPKLEQVVLEGQGYKLILETSNNIRVKHFLVSVPSIVTKIREIHNAVVTGDLQGVESAIERPMLLISKDEFGMTPLHKSVLLEQDEMTKFIIGANSSSLHVKDAEGRTALHYASGLKDSGKTYDILCRAGTDPTALDIRGKSAEHYLSHQGELDMRQLMSHINRCKPLAASAKNDNVTAVTKRQPPSNLRPVHKAATGGVTSESIAKLLQLGDLEKLEQLVLDGYGKRLLGKSSWNEDVRNYLKRVPHCMDKIYAIHMASASGDLILLQQLLDRKKFVLSKDEYGHTALHKAVKYGQLDVVKYLLQTVPSSHSIRDQDGRTPLHYAAMYRDRGAIYNLLIASGAHPKIQDQRGKSAEYYFASLTKLESPIPPKPLERIGRRSSSEDGGKSDSIESLDQDKQISSWIENSDIKDLENLVIEGQGEKLLGKSSENPETQAFLEAVPALMGKIRAVHNAAANGDVKDLQSLGLTENDVLALSRDEHGACPLHKAVLYGHHNAMKFLATNYPASLRIQDNSGLTSLHYAALVSSDGYFYRLLHNFGADPNVKDKNGFTPGQILRGNGPVTGEELFKRYEEKRVPPRPHSVQTWERPPTEEILRALTPSPMTFGQSDRSEKRGSISSENFINETKDKNGSENEKLASMLVKEEKEAAILDEENKNGAILDDESDDKSDEADNNDARSEEEGKNDAILVLEDEVSDILVKESDGAYVLAKKDGEEITFEKEEKVVAELVKDDVDAVNLDSPLDGNSEGAPKGDVTLDELTTEDTYDEIPVDNGSEEADGTESELDSTESGKPRKGSSGSGRQSSEGGEVTDEKSNALLIANNSDQDTEKTDDARKEDENDADEVEGNDENNDNADIMKTSCEKSGSEMDNDTDKAIEEDNFEGVDKMDDIQEEDIDDIDKPDDGINPTIDNSENNDDENQNLDTRNSNDEIYVNNNDFINDDQNKVAAGKAIEILDDDKNEKDGESGSSDVEGDADKDEKETGSVDDDIRILKTGITDAQALNRPTSVESDEAVVVGANSQLDSESTTNSIGSMSQSAHSGSDAIETGSLDTQQDPATEEAAILEDDGKVVPPLDVQSLEEETNNNNTLGQFGNPLHWTKEGEYLTAVLGDALITALAEVSRMRPEDPIAYLALLLYRYIHKATLTSNGNEVAKTDKSDSPITQLSPRSRLLPDENGAVLIQDLCRIKTTDGSNVVHFAAGLSHDGPGDGLFELLRQSNYNLAERDQRFRTARDVANELDLESNEDSIDRYVFHSLRAGGEGATRFIEHLILDGYNHLLEITDDEGNDLIMVAELMQNVEAAQLLKGAQAFQDKVELLHEHIRNDNKIEAISMLELDPKLGMAKNTKGQTAVHVAVLCENEDIVERITNANSSVVNEQDNMGRTPLHYAMGTTNPQVLAKIIVKQGGNQFSRDAAAHMPSFYFINNTEIQKLKDELEEITI